MGKGIASAKELLNKKENEGKKKGSKRMKEYWTKKKKKKKEGKKLLNNRGPRQAETKKIGRRIGRVSLPSAERLGKGRGLLTAMAEDGKKGKKGKDPKKDQHDQSSPPSEREVKPEHKDKKSLRFQLPSSDISSEESFISALSYNPLEEDDYEDFKDGSQSVSILRKYVLTPLHHSQPRTATMNHCCRKPEEMESLLSDSSRQLFEIVRHSPIPSDVNLNLINATHLRKLEAVKEAIREGADVNTSRVGQSPLLIAAEIGDDRLVGYLLTVPKINPDFQNSFGQTPLIVAVKNSFDKIARLLLEHKADVNLPDNMGKTPLLAALFQKRLKMTKLLLSYGADCNKPDLFGETPLYAAAVKTPDYECLLMLLKTGASPECLSLAGTPLLSRAIVYFTDLRIIEALVQFGASVNCPDLITKKTPLHYAALTNDLRVTKFLVSQGANLNLKTAYGFTPLEEAITQKSARVADYLMNRVVAPKKKPMKWPRKGRTDVLYHL